MKHILFSLFFFLSHLFSQSDLEKANLAYTSRSSESIKNKANESQILLAIQYYLAAIENESSHQASIGILKSYYYYGKFVLDDNDEKKKIFNKAVRLGEKFIIEYPDSPGIRYWYLVNLGSWAEVYGVIAAARSGFADTMKAHSEKIIELDNKYNDGGGYFMLGVVHLRAPYVPLFLSWPDKNKAEQLLKSAATTGKFTLPQKFNYAKSLYENNNKKEAFVILQEIIQSTPTGENQVEMWDQIIEAKQYMENIKD